MSAAIVRMNLVRIWCAGCDDFVTLEGPMYEAGASAPTHITPTILAAHREKAGHP